MFLDDTEFLFVLFDVIKKNLLLSEYELENLSLQVSLHWSEVVFIEIKTFPRDELSPVSVLAKDANAMKYPYKYNQAAFLRSTVSGGAGSRNLPQFQL